MRQTQSKLYMKVWLKKFHVKILLNTERKIRLKKKYSDAAAVQLLRKFATRSSLFDLLWTFSICSFLKLSFALANMWLTYTIVIDVPSH